MKYANQRELNIECLRIISSLFVLTYHLINTCVPAPENRINRFFMFFPLWGGGRVAVNVFVIISAWYLCDKSFRFIRLLEPWLTTLIYSLLVGFIFFMKDGNVTFLIRSAFPIINNLVWFISAYIIMLILSPLLIKASYSKMFSILIPILFLVFCIVPTFYPRTIYMPSNIGWFCLLFWFTIYLKRSNFSFLRNRKFMFIIYIICSFINVGWFCFFSSFPGSEVLVKYGYFENFFFGILNSLPCVWASYSLFFLFKGFTNLDSKSFRIISFIAPYTLDVYVLLALNGPGGNLFWVEMLNIWKYVNGKIINAYVVITIAFFSAIVIGFFRAKFVRKIINHFANICVKIDLKINLHAPTNSRTTTG